jgi:pyruvate/oxaloacetate carboxyltransferase
MTTGMMHPVLRDMDQAGFDAMEFFVSISVGSRNRKGCQSVPREYDETWYHRQVPGRIISNLRHQLKMPGKAS